MREPFDKSLWGPGPWQDEPDHIEWDDAKTRLKCIINRCPGAGHLCGYVGVLERIKDRDDENALRAHGGITFNGYYEEHPGLWFFGFDCGHGGDISPGSEAHFRHPHVLGVTFPQGATYKDVEYVKSEIEDLVKQIFDPLTALADTLKDD